MRLASWLIAAAVVCASLPQAAAKPLVKRPSRHGRVHRRGGSVPWLAVHGTQLTLDDGRAVVLRGVSTHGLQWFPQFANENALRWLRDDWKISVIRAAMYTAPEANGFIANRRIADRVHGLVEAAIRLGMYVIIDWHILSDNNPNMYRSQASAFFREEAKRYGNVPNVLFEICNEPNGSVYWGRDIKPYAEELISVIRPYAPKNIIIVGTSTWSQDVDIAAASPLVADNIMYTLHFYAGTHTQWLRQRTDEALAKGLPIFVTEWGVSESSGNGGVFTTESQRWLDFLAQRRISWVNWNLSDGNETSALLNPGASTQGGWSAQNLSPAGQFVKAAALQPLPLLRSASYQ